MDAFEDLGRRSEVKKEARFRRTVALQIYFPVVVFIVLLAALGVGIASSESGSPSVWADVALIMLLPPLIVLILLLVAGAVAMVVGVSRVARWVRIGGKRAAEIVDRVGFGVKRAADGAARPVIAVQGVAAVLRRAGGLFGSLFRAR